MSFSFRFLPVVRGANIGNPTGTHARAFLAPSQHISIFPLKRKFHMKLIKQAEVEVGYPTSLVGLRCLLSDEFSTIVGHVRQLVGTGHPLIEMVRKLLAGDRNGFQTNGLLILLLSKLAASSVTQHSAEIISAQRDIAELTEMLFIGYSVHSTIQNQSSVSEESLKNVQTGNKLAILIGDYILAKVSVGAAKTNIPLVVEHISHAVGEAAEGQYLKWRFSSENERLTVERWTHISKLCVASPMMRFARSAILTSQAITCSPDKSLEDAIANLAYHTSLANMSFMEIKEYSKLRRDDRSRMWLPTACRTSPHQSVDDVIEQAAAICADHVSLASVTLSTFPESQSKKLFSQMLQSLIC